jgi:hypothetical protein
MLGFASRSQHDDWEMWKTRRYVVDTRGTETMSGHAHLMM